LNIEDWTKTKEQKKIKRTSYLHNSSLGLAQILHDSCTQNCRLR